MEYLGSRQEFKIPRIILSTFVLDKFQCIIKCVSFIRLNE